MMVTSSKKQISRENSIAACLNPRQTAVGAAAAPQLNANTSGGKTAWMEMTFWAGTCQLS